MSANILTDNWLQHSVNEILTQAQFTQIAYCNIAGKVKNENIVLFSSIHSFLTHCAMVSKLLKATYDDNTPNSPGYVLGISENSPVHDRTLRNHLEHYDERLAKWVKDYGVNRIIVTDTVGPKRAIQASNALFVRHYDPETGMFIFLNDDFDLQNLFTEVRKIDQKASSWLKDQAEKR